MALHIQALREVIRCSSSQRIPEARNPVIAVQGRPPGSESYTLTSCLTLTVCVPHTDAVYWAMCAMNCQLLMGPDFSRFVQGPASYGLQPVSPSLNDALYDHCMCQGLSLGNALSMWRTSTRSSHCYSFLQWRLLQTEATLLPTASTPRNYEVSSFQR
jgi:hypothetical protein